jgi:hypothetical protein
MEDLRSDINVRFDQSHDRITALNDRVAAVEGKIAGLHRRIDAEFDSRKQHDVRLSRIEKRLGLPARA